MSSNVCKAVNCHSKKIKELCKKVKEIEMNCCNGGGGGTGTNLPDGMCFSDYLFWDGNKWENGNFDSLNRIHIGCNAGQNSQLSNAIAIGTNAGLNMQGENSIAIGNLAGGQTAHANTIILNASGSALNSETGSAFYVNPIRESLNNDGLSQLFYNPATSEIVYIQD